MRTIKGSRFDWRRKRYTSVTNHPNWLWCNSVSLLWVTIVIAAGEKGPDCKTQQLPPSSAEIKNKWSCTFTPVQMTNLRFPYLSFIISSEGLLLNKSKLMPVPVAARFKT